MNVDIECAIAGSSIRKRIDVHCERALIEIHLLANIARQQVNAMHKHENRSAGQRRRRAEERKK